MERQTFDKSQIERMAADLKQAPPAERKLSKAQALRELEPVLQELRQKRGYTLEALVDLLRAKGLDVKVSTLQGALKKPGAKKKKAPPAIVEEKLDGAVVNPASTKAADVAPAGMTIIKPAKKVA